MMNELIVGKVSLVNGGALIASSNGVTRTAKMNDPVFYGDRIITQSSESISVSLMDGNRIDIGRLSDISVDDTLFNQPGSESIQNEIEHIQTELSNDDEYDPTLGLTTAAGPSSVLNNGGGHDFVKFDLNNLEVTPDSGAETEGFSDTILIIEDELPFTDFQPSSFDAGQDDTSSMSANLLSAANESSQFNEAVYETVSDPFPAIESAGLEPQVDDQPTANCYIDFVSDYVEDNIITSIEEDLFTGLGLPEDSVGADKAGIISSLTFTNEAGSQETVSVPVSGITVDTLYGNLTFNQDGSYQYTVDDDITSLSGSSLLTNKNLISDDITIKAFTFGNSYLDADNNLDLSAGTSSDIYYHNEGLGVKGTQNGMPANYQINHDKITGESEALSITFDNGPVSEVSFTVARMYQNENGYDEAGKWLAFDENGELVGEGAIKNDPDDPSAVQYTNSNTGSMTVTTEDTGGETFQTIVFTSTYYTDDGEDVTEQISANDSSDYIVQNITWEQDVEDTIGFTLEDADGDSDTGSLTFQITDDPETEETDLAEKLAIADNDGPLPNLDSCEYTDQEFDSFELDALVPQPDMEMVA